MPIPIITIIIGVILAAALLFWLILSMRKAEEFAKSHGLTISKKLFGYRMEGFVQGVPISIRTERDYATGGPAVKVSGGRSSVVICADVSKAIPEGFILQRDFGDPRVARIETGVPELDEGYILQCPDVESALSLVRQDPVRTGLTALLALCPNFFIRYGRIEARRPGAELDEEIPVLMNEIAKLVTYLYKAGS